MYEFELAEKEQFEQHEEEMERIQELQRLEEREQEILRPQKKETSVEQTPVEVR